MTAGPHRGRLRAVASLALLAALVAAAAWFVRGHWPEFRALALANPRSLLPLVALVPAMSLANGLQLSFLVRPFGLRLGAREWFGLAVVTNFYNTITPFRGGMFAKAAYLKGRHELSLTGFLAVSAGVTLANICGAGALGLAGMVTIGFPGGTRSGVLAAFFGAAVLGPAAVAVLDLRLPPGTRPLWLRLGRLVEGWRLIRGDTGALAQAGLATAVQYAVATAATVCSFDLIGVPVGLGPALFLTSLTALSGILVLTPAGLGVVEAAAVLAGLVVGITPAQSLTTALSRRLITAAVNVPLGLAWSLWLLRAVRDPDPTGAGDPLTPPR